MDKKIRKNYKAWNIKEKDFSKDFNDRECFEFFINYAILAPSSHNSQPWSFLVNDEGVIIKPETSRSLKFSDKNNRQLFISLGAITAFYIITANNFGYNASYSITKNNHIVIICNKGNNITNEISSLFDSILKRVTNRNEYEKNLNINIIEGFSKYKIPEVNTIFISNKKNKKKLTNILINAGIEAMESSFFRSELSKYIKSNITNSFVGMPAFGMGIPLGPSLFAPYIIKKININKITKNKDRDLLLNKTPLFCILETRGDSISDWIKVGYQYSLYTLYATFLNIATHPYAGPIQIGNYYKDIMKLIKSKNRPQFLFRIGIPKKETKHSPRILSKDVISQ